jgi:hypothetical protein
VSKITESARGEDCAIRLVGICNFDRATTVWCHANGSAAGKGIGMKSHDLLGAYGCSACHAIVDRLVPLPSPYTREMVKLAFAEGHFRSLLLLIEKGIVVLQRGKTVVST